MDTNKAIRLFGRMVVLPVVLFSLPVDAQTAYGSVIGRCDTHNACWQALKIPRSTEYPTGSIAARLEACKAAGGPDAYFGRRVEGMRLCRIVNGTIVLE